MASPEQIKTIRKLSGLSKKKKLKPITTERADEIIEALNWDEAVFVDLLDDKQIKLRPIYPQGRRRRKR